jgi:hypothetical protein
MPEFYIRIRAHGEVGIIGAQNEREMNNLMRNFTHDPAITEITTYRRAENNPGKFHICRK